MAARAVAGVAARADNPAARLQPFHRRQPGLDLMPACLAAIAAGVRRVWVRALPPSPARIRVSAMSVAWLQTYEDDSAKHGADI
jgi:hypothetical protein